MEIYYLEDLGVDGCIVLKLISKNICRGGTDWIATSQDRDRWHSLAVMNLRFS